MRRLHCPVCGNEIFFDSLHCVRCGATLALEPSTTGGGLVVRDLAADRVACRNREAWSCNWTADPAGPRCRSCVLVDSGSHDHDWSMVTFQAAQRRALHQLTKLGVPWTPEGRAWLRFAYRSKSTDAGVVIGHRGGSITLDLDEADPAVQEGIRARLGEQYRTPLGHLRHELGHFVWLTMVAPDTDRLERFRELFGDERADYAAALAQHYERADDGSWREQHASFYASAHPWEDVAESWAQLMHIDDVVETGTAWGVVPALPDEADATAWLTASIEAGLAANELARAMGMRDLYPFALSSSVLSKVEFCWALVHADQRGDRRAATP
ncbi:MAG: putative zinc-binding metallopeptidase [Ilumatobacteraceae bacterium]